MEELEIQICREPDIKLACTLIHPSTSSSTLVVFLNGIDNPKTLWFATIKALQEQTKSGGGLPALLMYDWPGQGKSKDRYPDTKIPGRPKGHSRDCQDAAQDLHALITQIALSKLNTKPEDLKLVLIAASMGVAISRLYAQTYPGTVAALLCLDSTIANSDTVSIFPDPDAENFDESALPDGVTTAMCREARKRVRIHHPSAPNREGLWRGNLPSLLPFSDGPKLVGDPPPWVTVMENDRAISPEEAERLLGLSAVMSQLYFDVLWHEYNVGLTRIGRGKGLIEAKGCGHLIHKDAPGLVAGEIGELLEKVKVGGGGVRSRI